jgi:hypothetical protein
MKTPKGADLKLMLFSFFGLVIGLLFLMHNPLIVLGAAIFLLCAAYFSLRTKFVILSIGALYPFSVGTIAGKDILLIEAIAPVLFLIIVYHLVKGRYTLFPKEARLFLVMLLLFLVCVVYHFFLHPVSAQIFGVSSESSRGLKLYYSIFISLMVYLSSLWYFSYYFAENTGNSRWLKLVVLISIAAGVIRLISYFFNVEMPFLSGTFRYAEAVGFSHSATNVAHRIGGLDTVSLVGFPALIACYYRRKLDVSAAICFALLAGLTIAGGGRSQLFGLLLSFVVYFLLINRKRSVILIPIIVVAFLTANLALKSINMPQQFRRLQSVSADFAEMDPFRSATFEAYWQCFRKSPLFGKGIGYVGAASVSKEYQEFVAVQLIGGGHGAYMSMLAIFGAIGLSFFVVFLFGGMIVSFKLLMCGRKSGLFADIDSDNLLVFSLLYLLIVSVVYTAGNAGYEVTGFFFVLGMVCGLKRRASLRNASTKQGTRVKR